MIPLTHQELNIVKRVAIASGALSVVIVIGTIFWTRSGKPGTVPTTSSSILSAEVQFRNTNQLLPIDIEAHRMVANTYIKTDRPKSAIPHLLRTMAFAPKNRSNRLMLATAYIESGSPGRAVELLQELSGENNTDSLFHPIKARYGLALFYAGKPEESLRALRECVTTTPDASEAWCFLGQVEAALNPSDSATVLNCFRRALQVNSHYTEAMYQTARYRMNRPAADTADYLAAREFLLKVIHSEPLNARTHARLGMVYYYLDLPQQAEASYRTALTLNPDDYNTHYNLGELEYVIRQDTVEALRHYLRCLSIAPAHGASAFRVGMISLANGAQKEAIRYLETARESEPSNTRILLQLAIAYEMHSDPHSALNLYERILALNPLNDVALNKIAMLRGQAL